MTFRCERCKSRFSPIRVSFHQNCPRCRARDRVSIPLTLELSPFSGGFKLGPAERETDNT
jgi:hypothetical protein